MDLPNQSMTNTGAERLESHIRPSTRGIPCSIGNQAHRRKGPNDREMLRPSRSISHFPLLVRDPDQVVKDAVWNAATSISYANFESTG